MNRNFSGRSGPISGRDVVAMMGGRGSGSMRSIQARGATGAGSRSGS